MPSANVTYQISHKCQVCYAEERCQHIQPHAVEVRHIDHGEVHVDGTHDHDHQSSSDLKHSAGGRQSVFKTETITFKSVCLYDVDKLTIRWQTHS